MLAQTARSYDTPLLQALREQTAKVHEQLHHHSHFVALFEQSIERQQYRALLTRFHGFYTALDTAIERCTASTAPVSDEYVYAPRAGLLAQDLTSLGVSPVQLSQNPRCERLLEVITPASLAGVLYVIEGSTLGAAQIDRAAQKLLSKDSLEGRRFWAWSRAHNKERWALILRYIADTQTSGAAHAPIIAGAHHTFQALADWLAPLETPFREMETALQ